MLASLLLNLTAPVAPVPVVSMSNQMGIEALRELNSGGSKNLCISPISITTAGTMLREGAGRLSDPTLSSLLHQSGTTASKATSGLQTFYQSIAPYRAKGVLFLANGVWSSTKLPVKKAYTVKLNSSYGAEARSMDFGKPDSHRIINKWVSEHTNGRINDLFKPFDSQTCLVLANCIYFKDQWVKKLPLGREIDFKTGGGKSVKVVGMTAKSPGYDSAPEFERVVVRYKSSLQMELYLPGRKFSVESVLKSKSLPNLAGQGAKAEANTASFPKWKSEYSMPLADFWKSHGGAFMFKPGKALFPGIIDGQSWIQQAVHKTYILVDEKGTEAAAATGIAVGAKSAPGGFGPDIVFDRPFVYMITDPSTRAVLFVGVMNNPKL